MSFSNSSGGDVIAQCVIDPVVPSFVSQYGFKGAPAALGVGVFTVQLNAEMNFAAPSARQVIGTIDAPDGGTTPFFVQTQLQADPQTIKVLIFDPSGIAVPPPGSRVQLSVVRVALPQG